MKNGKPPVIRHAMVVFAKNRKRVSLFYQRALGLAVAASDRSHDRLTSEAFEVMVHCIPKACADTIRLPRRVLPREDSAIKPVFVVPSLMALRAAIQGTGGQLQSDDRRWHYEGFAVLDGWDPEGNVLQFREGMNG